MSESAAAQVHQSTPVEEQLELVRHSECSVLEEELKLLHGVQSPYLASSENKAQLASADERETWFRREVHALNERLPVAVSPLSSAPKPDGVAEAQPPAAPPTAPAGSDASPGAVAESPPAEAREPIVLKDPRSALCLSGGGIRSATFCLGVLQALAEQDTLRNFHYMSTVSGGGYIGSWLTAWIRRTSLYEVVRDLAPVRKEPRPNAEAESIRNLRAYSNYLSPVWGLSTDLFTLFATFLRNLTLNWCTLVPLLVGVLALPRLMLAAVAAVAAASATDCAPWQLAGIIGACLLIAVSIGYMISDIDYGTALSRSQLKLEPLNRFGAYCFAPSLMAAILLTLAGTRNCDPKADDGAAHWPLEVTFIGASLAVHALALLFGVMWRHIRGIERYALAPAQLAPAPTFLQRTVVTALTALAPSRATLAFVGVAALILGELFYRCIDLLRSYAHAGNLNALCLSAPLSAADQALYATFAVPIVLACLWLACCAGAGITRRWATEDYREWWSRAGAWSLFVSIAWAVLSGLVIYGPQLVFGGLLTSKAVGPGTLSAGAAALGTVTSLFGYWSKNSASIKHHAQSFVSATGVRILELIAGAFTIVLCLLLAYVGSELIVATQPAVRKLVEAPHVNARKDEQEGPKSAANVSVTIVGDASAAAQVLMHSEPTPPKSTPPQSMLSARDEYVLVLTNSSLTGAFMLVFCCLVISLVVSIFIGANAFSLHGMYGNRLVRAYLGATNKPRRPHWFTGFDDLDNVPAAYAPRDEQPWVWMPPPPPPPSRPPAAGLPPSVAAERAALEMATPAAPTPPPTPFATAYPRLFHVVNIALNLARPSQSHLSWQQRKAASFVVTPQFSGSSTLGYVPTREYAHDLSGMTLGRAMTISGAAASPNMGYHTSSLVAFVMTFFNVRLGWWSPNPSRQAAARKDVLGKPLHRRSEPVIGLRPMLEEALAQSSEDNPYVYLSDGGHFENLGLYEMVRRRCHRIVVVDAAADPKYEYSDLEDAIRKIRIDFGIPITFAGKEKLPRPRPDLAAWSQRIAVGKIEYSCVDGHPHAGDGSIVDGVLVVIKPVLLGDEPLDVLRYAAACTNPDAVFPQEPTSDQFFSESQFESYRMLGLHTGREAFGKGWSWPVPGISDDGTRVPEPTTHPPLPRLPAAAAAAVAATGAAAGSEKASAGASGGLASLFGSAVQMIGQNAMLAAVVTVGGVVGVTLHVTGDSTVKLDDADRQLLNHPVAIDVKKVQLDPDSVRRLDQGVAIDPDSVASAVLKLSAASASAAGTGTVDTRKLDSSIAELQASIKAFKDAVDSGTSSQTELPKLVEAARNAAAAATSAASAAGVLQSATSKIAADINAIRLATVSTTDASAPSTASASGSSARSTVDLLAKIESDLRELTTAVNQTNPRLNIRSVPQGSQR